MEESFKWRGHRDTNNMKLKQITIIGVGLIGGSLGLAIKKRHLASRLIGVTAHKSSLKKALRRRAIDSGTLEVKDSVLGSDIVIIATPIHKVLNIMKKIAPYLKKGCIVIDVASVKGVIVHSAEKILGKKAHFVGAHPMAGSEESGIDKADGNLFKNAPCILTKTGRTNVRALKIAFNFWKKLGSKIYTLSPSEHDKRISAISHLPHIAACALSLVAKPSSIEFASTGFKDTTRIAAGNPELWMSIFMANRRNVASDIESYLKSLKGIRKSIVRGQRNKLRKLLLDAKKKRDILKYTD